MNKQEVYEDLKSRICEERLVPGQWLVERELCETYTISRTPVREILWRLFAEGFLQQVPNRGFAIRRLNLEEIFEIFQTREAVEGMAARLACRKGGEAFFAQIRDIRDRLSKLDIDTNVARGIALGRRMHNAVIEAADNRLMSEFYTKLKNLTVLTSNLTRKAASIERVSKVAHLAILDAIARRDEEASEQLMRTHLRDTCRLLIDVLYPGMV